MKLALLDPYKIDKISIDGLDLLKWSKATPEVRRKETTARVHSKIQIFYWFEFKMCKNQESSINLVLCCIKANVKFNWKHKSSSTNIDLEINRVETSKALLWRIVNIQFLRTEEMSKSINFWFSDLDSYFIYWFH